MLLHAFTSGATALTGVEEIANGITAFKHPKSRNAAAALVWAFSRIYHYYRQAAQVLTTVGAAVNPHRRAIETIVLVGDVKPNVRFDVRFSRCTVPQYTRDDDARNENSCPQDRTWRAHRTDARRPLSD